MFFFTISCQTFSQNKKSEKVSADKAEIVDIKDFNAIPQDMLSDKVKEAIRVDSKIALPQDGIVYDIISSKNTTFNDCFSCGPAVGHETSCISKYTVETRRYTEYKKGVVYRVWMSTVSVFMGCGVW